MLDITDSESVYTEATGYIQFQCIKSHENRNTYKFVEVDTSLFVIFRLEHTRENVLCMMEELHVHDMIESINKESHMFKGLRRYQHQVFVERIGIWIKAQLLKISEDEFVLLLEKKLTPKQMMYESDALFQLGPMIRCIWSKKDKWRITKITGDIERFMESYNLFVNMDLNDIMESVHPNDVKIIKSQVQQFIQKGEGHIELLGRFFYKGEIWRWIRAYVYFFEEKNTRKIGTYFYDLTQQKSIQEKLEESSKRYQELVEAAQIGTWSWNILTGQTDYNIFWFDMLGYEARELMPTTFDTWVSLMHPKDKQTVIQEIERQVDGGSRMFDSTYRMRHKDGRWVWFHDRGKVMKFTKKGLPWIMSGTCMDITTRKEAEQMLQHNERLTSVGRLAGGIAHDINNQLMMMRGYVDLLLEHQNPLDAGVDIKRLDTIIKTTSDIVRKLLAFSKQSPMELQHKNLVQMVESLYEIIKHSMGKEVEITYSAETESIEVEVDPSLMQNAILNICINAKDALVEYGSIQINVDRVVLEERLVTPLGELEKGCYGRVVITDSGVGMEEHIIEHIFEPFFSTKKMGTGIGLATVAGVIKQHKGGIRVNSVPDKGSSFEVYIPCIKCEDTIQNREKYMTGEQETLVVSEDKALWVMVVDDEPLINELLGVYLTNKGMKVISFSQPIDAVNYYKEHYRDIDRIILDVIMPHMSGASVLEQLIQINPDVEVIFLSGNTPLAQEETQKNDHVMAYMEKPVKLESIYNMLLKDCTH